MVRRVVLAAVLTVATACGGARARPSASAHAGEPVVVYGASWCAHTGAARAYLQSHHVVTVFRDVERDPDALDEMYRRVQASGQEYHGIPVIDVHGRVLVGYEAGALSEALDE